MKINLASIVKSTLVLCLYYPMASFADYLPLGPFLGISDGVLIVEKVDRIIAMEDKQGNKYHLPK